MLVLAEKANRQSYDARMLAMADRLFREFEELPVRSVFRAIGAARLELRQHSRDLVMPEQIESLARQRLVIEQSGTNVTRQSFMRAVQPRRRAVNGDSIKETA